jgi:hypothetical protein
MGQHASNDFLQSEQSRRESATHHLVKPNCFFLLSRLWVHSEKNSRPFRNVPMARRAPHPGACAGDNFHCPLQIGVGRGGGAG